MTGNADDLCFIKSMHTDTVNHAPAISLLLSGGQIPGRPTPGSWLHYGLGSKNEDPPAFVVVTSVTGNTTCGRIFHDFHRAPGFWSPVFRESGSEEPDPSLRRSLHDGITALNELRFRDSGDPEIRARIVQQEMQASGPLPLPERPQSLGSRLS